MGFRYDIDTISINVFDKSFNIKTIITDKHKFLKSNLIPIIYYKTKNDRKIFYCNWFGNKNYCIAITIFMVSKIGAEILVLLYSILDLVRDN